jgi:hypothetical protein
MKLNEDNTITLSLKETQKFITKIINPEFKQLERLKQSSYISRAIDNLDKKLIYIQQKQNAILNYLKQNPKENIPQSMIRTLENEYSRFLWALSDITEKSPEEVREIEAAYQLYKMLLKNRRFKEEDEQASSLSEMPKQ